MNSHILNREDTRAFLQATCLDVANQSPQINCIIDDAKYWQQSVQCLSLFAAIFLERHRHEGGDCTALIERMYKLPESMFFEFNECGHDFISYLLRHIRKGQIPLHDLLTEIQTMYSDYDYTRAIRM